MHKNINKTNKIIQKYISIIIKDITNNIKNNLITITNIKTTQDLSKSLIYISILKNKEIILKHLNNSAKKIKHTLSIKIKTQRIPDIEFILDNSIEYENKISKLIQKTKNE